LLIAFTAGSVNAQSTPDQLLMDAFAQMNAGAKKNDEAAMAAGVEALRKFAQQAPDGHKLKQPAVATLAFLDQLRESERQLAKEAGAQPPTNPGRRVVRSGVISGRVLELPRPSKPTIAKEAKAHGSVSVKVEVGEDGQVARILAVAGHPLLQQAAVEAALKTRFAPTKFNGTLIKIQGSLVYNFE
jgi:TonB family protein